MWSIAWVVNGAKLYEHGYPDEDPHAASSR
jgi:hypothetical protein